MRPVWCWVVDPTITFITTAHSQDLTAAQANSSRELIKSNKFQAYFPHISIKETQDNKTFYENRNGGFRKSFSVGSSPTGNHALILIMDDPQNPAMADSEVERKNVNDWIGKQLFTRKADKEVAVTVLIQQRLHPQDVTSYLLSLGEEGYDHICLPAEVHGNLKPAHLAEFYVDGLMDPHRLKRETIEAERVRLGTRTFLTQYMQAPNDEESAILKPDWFPKISQWQFTELCTKSKPIINFFADTAFTAKTNRDPSAILACAKIGNVLYITGVSCVRYEFPRLVRHVKDWTAAQGYTPSSRIIIEPKASGLPIIQQLKAETSLNVIAQKDNNKLDKITRLNAISGLVESGKICLVESPHWNREFIEQVTSDSPVHDDIRDCFVAAVEYNLAQAQGSQTFSFLKR
jgi:predicted phage terminase large subunit-like protein